MSSPIIQVRNLHHTYAPEQGEPVVALRGVDLDIAEGEYVVILGHNGSGKSTLAKHLNALLLPTQGDVLINELSTQTQSNWREIRTTVGMVFQTPDNQIVATIVEEDVAFGPENLGLPREEIVARVDASLAQVDMLPYRHRPPHQLSGGQKQRICIAGVLAMRPRVLVLDEATAMLDPQGRQEVLEVVRRLHREQDTTVVAITHLMDEAIEADRVIVMQDGRIALQGTPREVFAQSAALHALHMTVPQITQLAHALGRHWLGFPQDVLTVDEFVAAVDVHVIVDVNVAVAVDDYVDVHVDDPAPLIKVTHLAHDYMRGTPMQHRAVQDVSLDVRGGEILGIIGHTGSGKSTVIQHLNALLRPHAGEVIVLGQNTAAPNVDVKAIRRSVGLVFQFPEAQLFEQFVGDDIAYGPRNLKLSREDVRARVRAAMEAVGLGFEAFKDRQTFQLSGGQMRRVAIAGVLALQPQVLVLDEPTAGLDPEAREQLFAQILALREQGMTLVIVSHNMEELARVCDRVCVIAEGRTVMLDVPGKIFAQAARLRELGLNVPPVTDALQRLKLGTALTVAEAVEILIHVKRREA